MIEIISTKQEAFQYAPQYPLHIPEGPWFLSAPSRTGAPLPSDHPYLHPHTHYLIVSSMALNTASLFRTLGFLVRGRFCHALELCGAHRLPLHEVYIENTLPAGHVLTHGADTWHCSCEMSYERLNHPRGGIICRK